jgi:hypothetical protein
MVDIDPAKFDAERKLRSKMDDMPWWWKEQFKGGRRLDIPLTHSRQLRQVAEILRILANNLERSSHYTEVPEQTILLEAGKHIYSARDALKALNDPKKSVDNVRRLK